MPSTAITPKEPEAVSQSTSGKPLPPELNQLREIIVGPDVSQLRSMIAQCEEDLRSLEAALKEQRDQYERKLDAQKRETRRVEENLSAELRSIADRLDDQKADRKMLSTLLIDMANRLEAGGHLSDQIEGLNGITKAG